MADRPKKPVSKAAQSATRTASPSVAPTTEIQIAKDAADIEMPATPDLAMAKDTEATESAKTPAVDATLVEPKAVADAPAIAKRGTVIMTDVIETGKKFAADAKVKVETAVAEFNEKAKTAAVKSAKLLEEVTDLTKGNVEALVESSRIAAKGVETLSQGAAEYGRKQFEKTSATMKSFASVKSPVEFFQLQSEMLSSSFDAFAAEASKNSEAMLKLAGDIVQPISTRVSVVTEKVRGLAA